MGRQLHSPRPRITATLQSIIQRFTVRPFRAKDEWSWPFPMTSWKSPPSSSAPTARTCSFNTKTTGTCSIVCPLTGPKPSIWRRPVRSRSTITPRPIAPSTGGGMASLSFPAAADRKQQWRRPLKTANSWTTGSATTERQFSSSQTIGTPPLLNCFRFPQRAERRNGSTAHSASRAPSRTSCWPEITCSGNHNTWWTTGAAAISIAIRKSIPIGWTVRLTPSGAPAIRSRFSSIPRLPIRTGAWRWNSTMTRRPAWTSVTNTRSRPSGSTIHPGARCLANCLTATARAGSQNWNLRPMAQPSGFSSTIHSIQPMSCRWRACGRLRAHGIVPVFRGIPTD